MELHERQQFDFLLHTAVERYVERLEQQNQGAIQALERLRADPEAETRSFVDAIFEDFLLNNPDGAAFILRALAARPAPIAAPAASIGATLVALAKSAFAALLSAKTEECLEQHTAYQAAPPGD